MYHPSASECQDTKLTMPSTYAASLSNGVYGSYYYVPSMDVPPTMPLNYRASFSTGYYGNYYYCNINDHMLKQKVLHMLRNTPLSEKFALQLNLMNFMNHNIDSNHIILDAIIHKAITEKPGGAFMEHYVALFSFIHRINPQTFQEILFLSLKQKMDSLSDFTHSVSSNSYLSFMLLIAELFTKLLIDQRIVCNIIESILSSANMQPLRLIGLCVLLSHCGRLFPKDHVSKYVRSIKQLSRALQKNKKLAKMIQSMNKKLEDNEPKTNTKSLRLKELNEQDQIMKNALIKSLQIMNIDPNKSTMIPSEFPFVKTSIHTDTFIASQSELKLLFVIEVHPLVRLTSIIIHGQCMGVELYGYLDVIVCAIPCDAKKISDFAVTGDNTIARSMRCPASSLIHARCFSIPQETSIATNKYAVHIAAVDGFVSGRVCINGITFSGHKTCTLNLKQLYLLFGKTPHTSMWQEDDDKREINEEAEKLRSRLTVIAKSQVSFLLSHIHDLFLQYFDAKLDVQFTSKWRPKHLILYFDDLFELREHIVFSNLCQNDSSKKERMQALKLNRTLRSRKEMEIIAKKLKSFDLNDLKAIFLDYFGYDLNDLKPIDFISCYEQYFKITRKKDQSVTVISKIYMEDQPDIVMTTSDMGSQDDDEPLSFERLVETPLDACWLTMFGLPSHLCDTHILSSLEWFGRWTILNIEFVENRVTIEFQKGFDTREAVRAMHGRYVEVDKRIRVETGHTYYCPAFLKNPDHPDCKRNCTLVHKWINKELFEKLSTVRLWNKRVICVRGLPEILCDDDTIRSWFGKFGEIEHIGLWRPSPIDGIDKILAFLTFYDERDARNAIHMMDGKYYKQYRTKLRVTQSYSLYCRDFLTNGAVHCSGYPRCRRIHRWIHGNEMIKPNITPQRQARELQKHIETEDDVDKYAYDGITGCVEDIRGIRLQSDNTIIVKGINDVQSCNKKVLRSKKWFGQFGPITAVFFFMKVVFVTFVDPNDAVKAIAWTRGGKCIDGQVIYTMMKHSPFCWYFLQNPHKPCRGGCTDIHIHKWISTKLANKIKDTQIVQRHVISVEGLSDDLCSHDVLISPKHFGQFGQIKSIQMSKSLHTARIAYYDMKNAMEAVRQSQTNHSLKVSLLRNKYCPKFLDKYDCDDSHCLYVHYWAPQSDIVCEEEVDQKETHEGKEVEEHDEYKELEGQEGTETEGKENVQYFTDDGDVFAKWLCKTVQMEEYLSLFRDR
eukprot:701538_1